MQSSFSWRQTALPAIILALLLPLTVPFAALAQNDDQQDGPAASAGSAVARIDAIAGDVAIQRGDSNDTVAAVTNAPVLGADYVTTGDNGRAEVGFDGRSAVRLGANVQLRFSKLDTGDRQMQLAAGTIDVRLFGDADGQTAIDTPSISILPRTAGSFRVSVDNNGETAVTIRSGRADIVTPQGTQPLAPGTTLIADGAASNPQIQTQPAIASDLFDAYNAERDRVYELASADSQYVNTDIQGVGDLNANGRWADDGTYGNVWIPTTVAADWAPYRDGNWVWEDGYGWTWVARESWGWAPYHYGRWYFSAAYHHWAWYPPAPGRYAPAWSPALVGFVGFNIGSVSVGIGFGNIGWVPLAPYEAFHPWWGGRGTTVVNNTTIINNYTTNVTNVHYRNLQVNNAMTSVTRENFQAGRFNERVAVSSEQVRTFRPVAVQGALPIVPTQANLRFAQRPVAPALAARPAFADRTFAGHAAVVTRTPFAAQQQSVSRVTHVAYRPATTPASAAAERAPQGSFGAQAARGADAAPSYSRSMQPAAPAGQPATRSAAADPWTRFNSNRATQSNAALPAYARPAAAQGASYNDAHPAARLPAYARPAAPAGTPSNGYSRFGNGTMDRQAPPAAAQPQVQQRSAQAQPLYQQRTAPAYARPAAPAYQRPAAPEYQRQAAPAYQRPAAEPQQRAQPAAHATHSGDDRRVR